MAVSLDATANGVSVTSTSLTFSHTCTGASILLVGFMTGSATDTVTGVTYGGVAMTRVDRQVNGINGRASYMYELGNPADGAQNVVISSSNSVQITGNSISYIGGPTTITVKNKGVTSGTTITGTINTTVDQSALFMAVHDNRTYVSAGTNTTQIFNSIGAYTGVRSTSNVTPAGATSLSYTLTTSDPGAAWIIVQIEPVASSAVKTAEGLAIASVKTGLGLATASVKTWEGLA